MLGLLLVLYPVVPIFALFALLWVGPQNDLERASVKMGRMSTLFGSAKKKQGLVRSKSREEQYYQIDYLAMTARAIAGGVESPLQLTFQVSHTTYLVLERNYNVILYTISQLD